MKNKIIKLMLTVSAVFTIFSCEVENNNTEITKYPTIAEIATANPELSVALKVINAAGLTSTFTGAGSYTLFAPNNAAFASYTSANFPAGFLTDAGLTDTSVTPNKPKVFTSAQKTEMIKILQYHLLNIGTLSSDLLRNEYSRTFAPTVTGTLSMFVGKEGTDVLVNGGSTNGGAKVLSADVNASNGVVHVIDNVLRFPSLVNHVKANKNLSTLFTIVTSTTGTFGDQSTIKNALMTAGETATTALTVYAPLNSAFDTATTGSGFLTGAAVNQLNVENVLKYHVEIGYRLTDKVAGILFKTTDTSISTLFTPKQFVIVKSSLKLKEKATLTVSSTVKNADVQATNGVIHTIDKVLDPALAL